MVLSLFGGFDKIKLQNRGLEWQCSAGFPNPSLVKYGNFCKTKILALSKKNFLRFFWRLRKLFVGSFEKFERFRKPGKCVKFYEIVKILEIEHFKTLGNFAMLPNRKNVGNFLKLLEILEILRNLYL